MREVAYGTRFCNTQGPAKFWIKPSGLADLYLERMLFTAVNVCDLSISIKDASRRWLVMAF